MDSFDIYITRRLTLVSLISTVFIVYPNIACIPWELKYIKGTDLVVLLSFFVYRFFFFWGLISLLIRYNLKKMPDALFKQRLMHNFLFSFIAYLLYASISYGVSSMGIRTDALGSILIFQFFVTCFLCTFIGYISMLYSGQREKEQEIERLRFENLQSRCDALANQINPHFFFNSLNGISALIRKKNDEKTLMYVHELSDTFRYILQSDRKGLVSLREELEFVQSFQYVMEVRFANKLVFSVEVEEEQQDLLRLPVLSLLPLLDNAVVHNQIDSEHKMEVSIVLNEQGELVVSNPVYPKLSPPDTNGTGLKNLESRFTLLMNKQIRIECDEDIFRVYLPLK
ncbi:sensor histidine kinase [Parabacteroides gordonii]|uniref:sensor histidine kinase n=1 Tax=Parabacteroides gordonii TaxID=574930 RepID=UPI0026EEFFC8|nr:histidine kinase [Parabacteroides gordonii]